MRKRDFVWGSLTAILMGASGIYGHQIGFHEAERWYTSTPNERGFVGCVNGSVLVKNIEINLPNLPADYPPIINIRDNPCGSHD